jgi:fucose 4-O-acetylase-like acetyltransferase
MPGRSMSVEVAHSGIESPRAATGRLEDIDRAKGFAIILVVFGHLVAREHPAGNAWYSAAQFLIYSFHMPFFVYLAGVAFFYSGAAANPRPDYWRYVCRRGVRLLVPFTVFGIMIVTGKSVAQHFLHVDNSVDDFLASLMALFWDTSRSPAESVWFVFVLFVYCALTPVLLRLTGGRVWPLLALAFAAYWTSPPSYFYLDRIAHYFFFFLIGSLGLRMPQAMRHIDRWFALYGAAFLSALTLLAFGIFDPVTFALCNVLSIPALHGLMRRRNRFARWEVFLTLGSYSFVIYLLNTTFIGLTKGALLTVMPWDGRYFLIFAPTLLAAGLIGPILLKEVALRRVPLLDRMTD